MEKVHRSDEKKLDQDYSKPWELSDVILLVEGQQFHVHRAILAMSSPVFSRMFTGDFKEKNAEEIPLPGKKADEIREMLLAIYPTSWKPVNDNNCYFLLALAQEYQITKLTEKCEGFLLEVVKKEQGTQILETLAVAQSYTLESVVAECINKTQSLSLKDLMGHEMYEQIQPLSQRKMIELQLQKAEKKNERLKGLAAEALRHWESVVSSLGGHIRHANEMTDPRRRPRYYALSGFTVEANMGTIQSDRDREDGVCRSLSGTHGALKNLKSNLEAIIRDN